MLTKALFTVLSASCFFVSQIGYCDEIEEKSFFEVSADHLIWEEEKNSLLLKGNVKLFHEGIGELHNDDEIIVHHKSSGGKKQVKALESIGKTTLTFNDKEKGISHTLICYGKLVVDHERLETVMTSPVDANGNVLEGKQILFQDKMGKVKADNLVLNYELTNGKMTPKQIKLQGNVKIYNYGNLGEANHNNYIQYALADYVNYNPEAKEVFLSANENKRVIFIDVLNNMQVSAHALKIHRDKVTDKESIEGIGNVRFSLLEQELEKVKQTFKE